MPSYFYFIYTCAYLEVWICTHIPTTSRERLPTTIQKKRQNFPDSLKIQTTPTKEFCRLRCLCHGEQRWREQISRQVRLGHLCIYTPISPFILHRRTRSSLKLVVPQLTHKSTGRFRAQKKSFLSSGENIGSSFSTQGISIWFLRKK